MRVENVWTVPPLGIAIGNKAIHIADGEQEPRVVLNAREVATLNAALRVLEKAERLAAPDDHARDDLYEDPVGRTLTYAIEELSELLNNNALTIKGIPVMRTLTP